MMPSASPFLWHSRMSEQTPPKTPGGGEEDNDSDVPQNTPSSQYGGVPISVDDPGIPENTAPNPRAAGGDNILNDSVISEMTSLGPTGSPSANLLSSFSMLHVDGSAQHHQTLQGSAPTLPQQSSSDNFSGVRTQFPEADDTGDSGDLFSIPQGNEAGNSSVNPEDSSGIGTQLAETDGPQEGGQLVSFPEGNFADDSSSVNSSESLQSEIPIASPEPTTPAPSAPENLPLPPSSPNFTSPLEFTSTPSSTITQINSSSSALSLSTPPTISILSTLSSIPLKVLRNTPHWRPKPGRFGRNDPRCPMCARKHRKGACVGGPPCEACRKLKYSAEECQGWRYEDIKGWSEKGKKGEKNDGDGDEDEDGEGGGGVGGADFAGIIGVV